MKFIAICLLLLLVLFLASASEHQVEDIGAEPNQGRPTTGADSGATAGKLASTWPGETGPGKWELYIRKNLNARSIYKFNFFPKEIKIEVESCGPLQYGRTVGAQDSRSVKIYICRGLSALNTNLTLVHEIDHAYSILNLGGYTDHGSAIVDECQLLQDRYPHLYSKNTVCGLGHDELVKYGRSNYGIAGIYP